MTRDLWLQSLNNKPLLENVVTGEKLQVAPEQLLDTLKLYRVQPMPLVTPLLRAVDRALREWSVGGDPSPLARLTICRQHCFDKAVLEGDLERYRVAGTPLGDGSGRAPSAVRAGNAFALLGPGVVAGTLQLVLTCE